MRRVGTAASHMYRERFLIDKYQLDAGELTTPLPELVEFTDLEVLDSSEDDDDGNSDK
jgi:hypothetical protein